MKSSLVIGVLGSIILMKTDTNGSKRINNSIEDRVITQSQDLEQQLKEAIDIKNQLEINLSKMTVDYKMEVEYWKNELNMLKQNNDCLSQYNSVNDRIDTLQSNNERLKTDNERLKQSKTKVNKSIKLLQNKLKTENEMLKHRIAEMVEQKKMLEIKLNNLMGEYNLERQKWNYDTDLLIQKYECDYEYIILEYQYKMLESENASLKSENEMLESEMYN